MEQMTTVWFRSHVERCLQEVFEDEVVPDEDGDYPFRRDTASCWLSIVDGESPGVRVIAVAAYVHQVNARLFREVNEINLGSAAKVCVNGRSVIAEAFVQGEAVSVGTLDYATASVSTLAAEVGPLLTVEFGGQTPFPTELSGASSG